MFKVKYKYRIKELNFDNDKTVYQVQRSLLGWFWKTATKCMGLYEEIQEYDDLETATINMKNFKNLNLRLRRLIIFIPNPCNPRRNVLLTVWYNVSGNGLKRL